MKKTALLLILLVVVAVLLTGCVSSDEIDASYWENRFATYRINIEECIIVDTVTGVCYWCDYQRMTVLLDTDGTPLLWEEVRHE